MSFCCAEEDCRRRTTPSSVRFLGRRVYLGAIVVLVSEGGVTLKPDERLRGILGVSLRTLKRWRRWWRDTFVGSSFWKHAQGYFMPPAEETALPASALERFVGEDLQARLIGFLTFLRPVRRTIFDVRCSPAEDAAWYTFGSGA